MMNAFFERSLDCPLSILFAKRTSANHVSTTNVFDLIAVISEVAEISPRIPELGVVASQFDVRLTMRELESAPLPQIRKLWLDTGFECSSDRTPISILNVNPLSVRVLHARHVPIMWQPFEGLVRLELSAGAGTSLPSLLFTLKSSPHLEALLLSLPSNRDNAVSRFDGLILLKRLKELLLSVDDADGAAFAILDHISFPSAVDIEFRFARPVPRSLCDRNDSLRQIALIVQRAWITVEPPVWVVLETDDPRISLEYPGTLWRPAWLPYGFDYSTRLCEGLIAVPLPSLVQLSIRIEHWEEHAADAIDIMQFNALFSAVPSITELNLDVHPKYIHSFTSALSTPDLNDGVSGGAGAGNGAEGPLRCPKLKHWALVWFAEEPSVDDFWRIERCCAARAEAGISVEHLCTSVVPELVLASLEKSVGLVSVLGEDL
ncbi:hypothetical protein BD413DRAFT_498617 [Trametes elegans]|nr:hypothetical protein BD413DRAFT_498617 [Trametes elegans]